LCVLIEHNVNPRQLVVYEFDPLRGKGGELSKIDAGSIPQFGGDLAPDGSRVAIPGFDSIKLLSTRDGSISELVLKGSGDVVSSKWSADGKTIFASSLTSSGVKLFRVSLNGHADVLWEWRGLPFSWAIPSPDGRCLAMLGATTDSNVWMIEDF
jgi:hypothetical protein